MAGPPFFCQNRKMTAALYKFGADGRLGSRSFSTGDEIFVKDGEIFDSLGARVEAGVVDLSIARFSGSIRMVAAPLNEEEPELAR